MSFYIHRNISILQRHVLVGQKLFWISTYHHKWELGKRDYSMERKAKWHLSNRQHPLDVWNSCFCGLSLLIWKRNRRSGPVKVARHLRMKFKSDLQPKLKMCLKTLHFLTRSVVLLWMMLANMGKGPSKNTTLKVRVYFNFSWTRKTIS